MLVLHHLQVLNLSTASTDTESSGIEEKKRMNKFAHDQSLSKFARLNPASPSGTFLTSRTPAFANSETQTENSSAEVVRPDFRNQDEMCSKVSKYFIDLLCSKLKEHPDLRTNVVSEVKEAAKSAVSNVGIDEKASTLPDAIKPFVSTVICYTVKEVIHLGSFTMLKKHAKLIICDAIKWAGSAALDKLFG
ncbi:hypothetical protein MRX96_035715 [Rhipicephalus microplus]